MAIDRFYWLVFAAFAVPAAVLELQGGKGGAGGRGAVRGGSEYVRFRTNYLAVFGLMMAGDWLQGPYVYHLYEHYGFSVRDIGRLFIAGFASSAVFGTVAGALADKYGRKRAALLYVATYALSCATKHSPHYSVLLLGRVLGGIATSLLFSVFEAWAVAAHATRGFEESLLADLFTKAVMLGNGVMAIAAGLVGSWLVQGLGLGPVAPFDAAILVLLLGGAIIALTWEENRGSGGAEGGTLIGQFHSAAVTIAKDERVALLGVMQALFEASMYTFVFLWTPALNPHAYVPEGPNNSSLLTDSSLSPGARLSGGRVLTSSGAMGGNPQLPHGLVFAIFMTASMVGTAVAGRLMAALRLERVLQGVFWAGAVLLFVPVMYHTRMADHAAAADVFEGEPHTLEQARAAAADAAAAAADGAAAPDVAAQLDAGGRVQLIAFCGFEVLIGLFWPSMMALRARYVPEEQRSTIINIFRVPLNAFVCLILWKVSDFPLGVIFALCCLFLAAAGLAQARLAVITAGGTGGSSKRSIGTETDAGMCGSEAGALNVGKRRGDAGADAVLPGAAPGARSNGSTLLRPTARSSAAVTPAAAGMKTPATALAAPAAAHQAGGATAAAGDSPRVLPMAAAGPGGLLYAVGASRWWSALLGGDRGRTSDSTASPAAPDGSIRP